MGMIPELIVYETIKFGFVLEPVLAGQTHAVARSRNDRRRRSSVAVKYRNGVSKAQAWWEVVRDGQEGTRRGIGAASSDTIYS